MANMFSNHTKKKIPQNISDCVKPSSVSTNLWIWCERIERLGKILFWGLIIFGVVFAIISSVTTEEVMRGGAYYSWTETDTTFNFGLFITSLLQFSVYAFIEYCSYHVLALLVGALASIVQNTDISANIALLNATTKGTSTDAKDGTATNVKKVTNPPKKAKVTQDTVIGTPVESMDSDLDAFYKQLSNMSTEDLKLILKDQKDLFSEKEIKAIEKMLGSRSDFSEVMSKQWICKKCGRANVEPNTICWHCKEKRE